MKFPKSYQNDTRYTGSVGFFSKNHNKFVGLQLSNRGNWGLRRIVLPYAKIEQSNCEGRGKYSESYEHETVYVGSVCSFLARMELTLRNNKIVKRY